MHSKRRIVTAVLLSLLLSTAHTSAEGLLSDLVGESGSLVSIGGGDAGSDGLVNLGLGGDDGNLVDVGIGSSNSGSSPIGADVSLGGSGGLVDVNANVGSDIDARASVGSSRGLVDVDANVGRGINAGVNIGGPGGLVGVDVGIGGGGIGGGGNVGGGNPGTPGGNGANGRPGANGNNVIVGNTGNNGAIGGGRGGRSSVGASQTAACTGVGGQQLMQIFSSTTTRGWDKASNIQLVPIKVCSNLRRQMADYLSSNSDYQRLVNSVAGDPLINAALGRTKYQPGHVLGVQRDGNQLTVYVF